MQFKQKKWSNKHSFTFNDEYLDFSYEDKSGSDGMQINYANIPTKTSISIEMNEWLRNVGILWMLLGAYQIGTAIYSEASLSGKAFWLTIGILCVSWAYFSRVKYTIFKTEQGNIFIIQDKLHDDISNEIKNRREKQLLEYYGDINMENELSNEIEKFKWLREQGVLSEEETNQKIAQVEIAHKEISIKTKDVLN